MFETKFLVADNHLHYIGIHGRGVFLEVAPGHEALLGEYIFKFEIHVQQIEESGLNPKDDHCSICRILSKSRDLLNQGIERHQ